MRLAALFCGFVLASCGGPRNGQTGDILTDACLHWTACITPPPVAPSAAGDNLAYCIMGVGDPPDQRLPWVGQGIAVSSTQLSCIAQAGLDCDKALDCVSTAAATPCPTPTWTCNGDLLSHCDSFRGDRVVSEDCAAAGLHCVAVGNEARCGSAACDPHTFGAACDGSSLLECQPVFAPDGSMIGGVVRPAQDCGAHDATCGVGTYGAACIGNGPACTPSPGLNAIACDGDVLITCDADGHQERTDCTASGLRCVMITTPNPAGLVYTCGTQSQLIVCEEGPNFAQCDGTKLQYCDEHGNAELDCKQLGYSDCADGHCVP